MLPALIVVLWVLVIFNTKYRTCVRLENGANLGYEAVFDLSRPYFKPIAVPRLQDGTPIVRDRLWSIKVTSTTIYGLSMARAGVAHDYRFAWRSDVGLVLETENPDGYERLVAEAGHANWDIEYNNIGTGALLNIVTSRSDFDVGRCPTTLITW
ncbi:hypothetical protein [Sulfitobacter sabulilitoris]|uniref:Uncharacterized protein n=1 Tax=Sulfitobacter sabulilitoris TaxID=2562655 RepID=A0A5S3P7E4_9RHOB|nr:hypothetical protein [Sulfitobacter sabulilitoris]TMM49206.1 hypothetical protein FDT80_18630 [Sulfitobacter sabulilitoris]